ncbi:hypothetical protein AB0I82_02930 [Streptomyces sp. NPDC050315]|uniref:MmyB family transcriptional regulator n=1 Tax=Streptomyces sp. NPDC050315 TaxID=3155039 RepID=UPI0034459F8A
MQGRGRGDGLVDVLGHAVEVHVRAALDHVEGVEVAALGTGNKIFHHPVAGTLVLDRDTLTSSTVPGQHIVIRTAEPDSPSAQGLRHLAGETAARERHLISGERA